MLTKSERCFPGRIAGAVLFLVLASAPVHPESPPPPLQAYGALPDVSLVTISPSGNRLAFRTTTPERDVVLVIDLEENSLLGGVGVADVNPRRILFANDRKVLLVAGTTRRSAYLRDAYEFSSAFVFDVEEQRPRQLLRDARDIYAEQSGLGRIVHQSADGSKIYMPAWVDSQRRSGVTYGLYEVSTETGRSRLVNPGDRHTIDWFLDANDAPAIREDMNAGSGVHSLWRIDGLERELLYEYETRVPVINISGWTRDRSGLVVSGVPEASDRAAFATLSVQDGSISEAIFRRDDADVERVLTDAHRVVHGVGYSGFVPSYEFFDADLNARLEKVREEFPDTAVTLWDWSAGFDQLVIRVSGGWNAGAYFLVGRSGTDARLIALERAGVPHEQVLPTKIDSYTARDGLVLPALVTARTQVFENGNAPLVVLPHGGPASYDRFEFDWLVQFLASRGYVVLQPQFRGSDGFGHALYAAGAGEWGRRMQTDLDDGVAWLVDQGLANPDRVCIVGGSYGGYAALAAGAFSPQTYRCVVSYNGVSDLRRMLLDERRQLGRHHWLLAYWEESVGADSYDREFLEAISPAEHAAAFTAPVLLLHGTDDTVVPRSQSERMHRALKRADKEVSYVKLDGEDHWLSNSQSRIALLQALDEFLKKHL